MRNERKVWEEFRERMTREAVFMRNSFEGAMVRTTPKGGGRYFVKFEGEKEFEADVGHRIVTEAIQDHEEVTKEEYESY